MAHLVGRESTGNDDAKDHQQTASSHKLTL